MDLGIAMVRRWARALYVPWCILFLPMALILAGLFRADPWIAGLVVWWLKPAFDRVLLHVLSRSVFGAVPSWRETLGSLPGLLRHTALFMHLTLWRIDPGRSFRLPVLQLEGLRGRDRRQRIGVLGKRTSHYAAALTIVAMHFEFALWAGLFGLAWMLVPIELDFNVLSFGEESLWRAQASWVCYLVAMTVIEPVYVAAGFALYLNRRTVLEGWDVELGLKRLSGRLRRDRAFAATGGSAFCVALLLGFTSALMGFASEAAISDEPLVEVARPPEQARPVIDEIMAREEFETTRTRTSWFRQDDSEPSNFPDWVADLAAWMAKVTEVLLWAALIAAAIFFLVWARRFIPDRSAERQRSAGPEIVAGMDIRRESLPADVIAAARLAWAERRAREAASLLYRAALSRLIGSYGLRLQASFTEGEVLAATQRVLPVEQHRLLTTTTRIWQRIAYAHSLPEDSEFDSLLKDWQRGFGTTI
jgi:hypothetical protein